MSVLTYFQRKKAKQQQAIATIDEAIPLLATGADVDEDAVEAAQLAAQLSDGELRKNVDDCRNRIGWIADIDRARDAEEKANAIDVEIAELDAAETARRKAFNAEIEPLQLRRNELRRQATTNATRRLLDTADPRVIDRLSELRQRRNEISKGVAYAQGEVSRCEDDVERAAVNIAHWRLQDNGAEHLALARETHLAHQRRLVTLKASVKEREAEFERLNFAIRQLEALQWVVWVTPDQIEEAAAV